MPDTTLTAWIVGAVATGGLGVLAFLVRNAFEAVTKGLGEVSCKMDALAKDMASSNVHAAGFESDVRGEIRALRDRLDRLERDVREASEGAGR